MKIKDYQCKCGHDDFFFVDKGGQKGIYCSYCGKWFKWADKDEQNLAINKEPVDKFAMLHEIYMEGVNMSGEYQGCWVRFKNIERIVDKYMTESEEV